MDFFNKLTGQTRDLLQSMTPGARITAGLLLAVVVVSMGLLFRTGTSRPDEYLFGAEPLSSSQISRMEVAMAEAGLKGWEQQGNRIRVPRGQKEAYIAAIGAAGALPHDVQSYMDEALNSGGLFEPREKWNLRTKAVRENQLSHLVAQMPWVEHANVMLDVEAARGPNRKPRATAAVFVVPHPNEVLDAKRTKAIKDFIAYSEAALTSADVNVTCGGDESLAGGDVVFDDPYLQARHAIERTYQQKLLDGLKSWFPGVRIVVSGDVDNTSRRTRLETTPEGAEMTRETVENESIENRVAEGGGPPGQFQNSASANGSEPLAPRENVARTERDSTDTHNVVGTVQEETVQSGYVPKEIYASIAIPSDILIDFWRKRNPDAAPEDFNETERQAAEQTIRTQVENFVKNTLPRLAPGENEYTQVEVVFFETPTRAPLVDPSFSESAMGWASSNWSTLSMLGLAAFSLLLLRNVARPRDIDPNGVPSPTLQLEPGSRAAATAFDDEEASTDRPRLRLRKGDSLKEDLSEMVRENPDAAAAILRSWISNAG